MPRARDIALATVLATGIATAQCPPFWHFPTAIAVSGASPFEPSCNGTQNGRNFRNSALESWIAADPCDPLHLVGTWQQDRWSDGGASGLMAAATFDGGRTWTRSVLPFSSCAGGGNRFLRASDPWVTISPAGTVHAISLSIRGWNNWRLFSPDGGGSWTETPVAEPFDLAAAPVTDGSGYFVGDYQGLAAAGGRFLSFFAVSGPGELPSAIFATTRPSGTDRSWNGRTEVNGFVLRRRPEVGKKQ